jgi:hypothetical protein
MRHLLAFVLLIGCTADVEPELPAEQFVITQLLFARAVDGVSDGFDLDGRTSDSDDAVGCLKSDYTDPDGNAGIDNATSGLMGLLELTEAAALEPLIQNTINDGELLMVVEVVGVDDLENDDSVDLWLWQAVGVPEIGTDGFIEPGQTVDRDPELEPSVVEDVALVDGVVIASGIDARIPIQVFDAFIDLRIEDASIRLTLGEDGRHSGILAGRFQYDGLLKSLSTAAIDPTLQDSFPALFQSMADLRDEDGVCRVMSATLAFSATDAFFFE